ncbi:hypothetical protein V8E52_011756 [Russula decolorans]
MPSYMNLVVLGLVASNVSPALSAPIRRDREQSLSHRGPDIEAAAAGKKALGPVIKKYGKQFLIGTGATMAFAYAFEKLNEMGKGSSTPSTTPATLDGSNAANTGNTGNTGNTDNTAYTGNTGNTDNTAYTGNTDNTDNTAYTGNTGSTAYTAYSANNANNGAYPSIPTYSTSTYPTAQTQNGYQRRAVDRDLPADIFGEPHLES